MTCGTLAGAKVEFLGLGQQFVAFGTHPDTRGPYYWVDNTPLDVPLEALPLVTSAELQSLEVEITALLPQVAYPGRRSPRRAERAEPSVGPVRDNRGLVVDGRDGWLSAIAFHVVHDAIAAGDQLNARHLAERVWERFEATADLERPAAHGARYSITDAQRKVADKLKLAAEGRLPPRDAIRIEPAYVAPTLSVDEARFALDAAVQTACARIAAWHAEPITWQPQIAIRASVGLGKTVRTRTHLLALRKRLITSGAPSQVAVFVPTHELAEEVAAAWRNEGVRVAVLRGYAARHPVTGEPMCRNLEMVEAAVAARLGVHQAACAGSGQRCRHYKGCPKQRNRAEVAAADVVVAAHDALFTGLGIEASSIGAILIDESFWQRAVRESRGLTAETFALELLGSSLRGQQPDEAIADLHNLRTRAVEVLRTEGPVARSDLLRVGLDEEACQLAIQLEERRLRDPGLVPGITGLERKKALKQVEINQRTHRIVEVWQAMQDLAAGDREHDGRMHVRLNDGQHEIMVTGVKAIHPNAARQADAAYRRDAASRALPKRVART